MDIAEQIRSLCAHAWLYNGDSQIDVSDCIDGDDLVKLDLSHDPPKLIREDREQCRIDGTGIKIRKATDNQLQTILDWLITHPPHPSTLTPREILSFLTALEEDLIETHARPLSRELFASIVPVPYEAFESGMRQLADAKLLSAERLAQILACVPVE